MADKWGWDITILVIMKKDQKPYYKLSPKVKIEYLNVTTSGIIMCMEALWKLDKAVKRIKPDIYVTLQTIGALSCLMRTHTTTTIYEAHGTRRFMPHSIAMTIAERFADSIVTLGKSHVKDYPKAKHIEVIPNFTSLSPHVELDYDSKIIVSAGRRCYEKNFERLEALWKDVHNKHTEWQLKIHHETKDMLSAYLEGSVYVMTSRFEGFGMVLIEAMTCGLPCIAFDCPYGPREIIEDGKTGYLIPYDDDAMFIEKLTYLMEHPEVREQMGRAAKETVKRFSQEETMKKWKNFYSQL
jgi:glycosyltransferase involved in cell wall biosynthesis